MKLFTRLLLILGITLAGWSSVAWGYTGWCSAVDGTQAYSFNFGSKIITDPSQNTAGQSYPNVYSWDSDQVYGMSCDCSDDITPLGDTYFQTSTALSIGHNDGTNQYYQVNDYLEASTTVFLGGGVSAYVPTPWVNISNKAGTAACAYHPEGRGYGTGAKGKLSLYIKKPFVGVVNISNVKIIDIYASRFSGSFGGQPISSVYMTGSVTVPQSCTINAGQIVTVDFGSFMSGEFKNKGQMPTGYTPKTISVPIKCNGMDANASLTLRFQADASADEPAAIKTSNSDVGVQITDDSGKVIEPNSGLIPFQLDDNLQATVTFHAAPISTTGNAPAEGTFSATAYIRVDFA